MELCITRKLVGCFAESRRDSVLQPRVARHELPWETEAERCEPQRGCVRNDRRLDATPVGLGHDVLRVAARQPWAVARESLGFMSFDLELGNAQVMECGDERSGSYVLLVGHRCGDALISADDEAMLALACRPTRTSLRWFRWKYGRRQRRPTTLNTAAVHRFGLRRPVRPGSQDSRQFPIQSASPQTPSPQSKTGALSIAHRWGRRFKDSR